MLLVGLYARVADIPREAFLDPATGVFRQDRVLIAYLSATFSPGTLAVVTVALLAASMSTLDGILVALSSIVANDLVLPLWGRRLPADPATARPRSAIAPASWCWSLMGVAAFAIALHPPRLLGIFGQVGVYGIVAASTAPILFGIVVPPPRRARGPEPRRWSGSASTSGSTLGGASANPAVCATWALLASAGLLAALHVVARVRAAAPEAGAVPDAEA